MVAKSPIGNGHISRRGSSKNKIGEYLLTVLIFAIYMCVNYVRILRVQFSSKRPALLFLD